MSNSAIVLMTVTGSSPTSVEVFQPAGVPRSASFPVPLSRRPREGLVDAQVLYSRGRTVDAPGHSWHVKIYRCASPELARSLEEQFSAQAGHIAAANARLGVDPLRPPWAMAPVFVARADGTPLLGTDEFRTRMPTVATEVRPSKVGGIPMWFDPAGPAQPESCLMVLSPLLSPPDWWNDDGGRPVKAEQIAEFRGVAVGIDSFHAARVAHCDVKVENLCHVPARPGHLHAGYVLVDSDALTPLDAVGGSLRATHLPPSVRMKLENGEALSAVDLLELDRYDLVIAVITALTTLAWTKSNVIDRAHDYAAVQGALRSRFTGGHGKLGELLADALRPGVLRGEQWSAEQWLESLTVPPSASTRVEPLDSRQLERFGADVAAVHRQLSALRGTLRPLEVPRALDEAVRSRAAAVQRRVWDRTVSLGLITVTFVFFVCLFFVLRSAG